MKKYKIILFIILLIFTFTLLKAYNPFWGKGKVMFEKIYKKPTQTNSSSIQNYPVITINKPLNNELLSGTVAIEATVTKINGTIEIVKYRVDNNEWKNMIHKIGEIWTNEFYSYFYSNGNHTIYVMAVDNESLASTNSVIVRFYNTVFPPSLTTTEPTNNSVINGITKIKAEASDSDGTVISIKYKIDNGIWNNMILQSGNIYTNSFNTISYTNGEHYIYVTAMDNDTNSITNTVKVMVSNTTSPPSLTITLPINNSRVSGIKVNIEANASDSDGTIVYVKYKIDNGSWIDMPNKTGSIYTNSFNSTAYTDGNHTIYVMTEDNDSIAITNSVNVIVDNIKTLTIHFKNGYTNFSSPKCWFWKVGNSGTEISASGADSFGPYFKTNLVSSGNYGILFKTSAKWESDIVGKYPSNLFDRIISLNVEDKEVWVVSWNKTIFTNNPSSVVSNCPYNIDNPFQGSYIFPGASSVSGGKILFSIFAPKNRTVELVGDWSATPIEMKLDSSSGYWWCLVSGANYGDGYKYSLDGDTISDPYGRAFMNSANDNKSIVINPDSYTWGDTGFTRPARDTLIIYEAHIRDFTYGDSVVPVADRGKYKGFIDVDKISYLTNLGINGVELMPMQEWPGEWYSWGYNNSGFFAPENSLANNQNDGSAVDDFKKLVDTLHQYGIAVILDVVLNHSDTNYNTYWLGRVDKDYYFDPAGTPWGNKFELRNPKVQKFDKDVIKFWLDEYHIDGFRFDATYELSISNFIAIIEEFTANGYNDIYYFAEDYYNRNLFKSSSAFITSWDEAYHHNIMGYSEITGYMQDRTRRPQHYAGGGGSYGNFGSITYYSKDNGWANGPSDVLHYFSNHDEGTMQGNGYSTQDSKTAAAHLFTSLGIPLFLMGEEIYRNRTPNNVDASANVVAWDSNRTNYWWLKDFYAGLIKLRKKHPALRITDADPAANNNWFWNMEVTPDCGCGSNNFWDDNQAFIGYTITGISGDNDFVILINLSNNDKTGNFCFPKNEVWKMVCDGTDVNINGISGKEITVSSGCYNITVPANNAYIYMSTSTN